MIGIKIKDINETSQLKIIALTYSISPIRGSEYSVGWNYVSRMSKHYDIYCIYGLAGDHMGDLQEIESIKDKEEFKNINFVG